MSNAYPTNIKQSSQTHLDVSFKKHVAVVEINRSPVNALNLSLLNQLLATFIRLENNDNIHSIILRSAIPSIFSAGADIQELSDFTTREIRRFVETGQNLCTVIENLKQPVIAVIQGHALGGGCEIALSCDLRIASEAASLGQPEIHLGLIPGWGGTQRLPKLLGKSRAMNVILLGNPINALQAFDIGLVNYLVNSNKVNAFAVDLATKIASQSTIASFGIKAAINASSTSSITAGLQEEIQQFIKCSLSKEHKIKTTAFLNRK